MQRNIEMTVEVSGANAKQVGGDHYKVGYQHWDMLPAMGYGHEYYVGQITKYLSRWRKKNGLRDLLKGQHFLEKLIELADKDPRYVPYNGVPDSALEVVMTGHLSHLKKYFADNEIDEDTSEVMLASMFANDIGVLLQAQALCADLVADAKREEKRADAEKPVSRNFDFGGYTDDDHMKWRCKKCGADLKLKLTEPPVYAHPDCASKA